MNDNAENENATPPSGESAPLSQEEKQAQAEREMLAALEASEDQQEPVEPPKKPEPAEAPPVSVRPVDMDPVEPSPGRAAPDTDANLNLILDIPVELKVEIGNSRLNIREVLNLAPGSIIELDRTAGSPADIIVNGTRVGQGDVVVVDESYGIRISKLVDPQERLDSL